MPEHDFTPPKLRGNLLLRPIRMAILVEPEDTEGLRKALQLCTAFWGGYYNPIIPVCQKIPPMWAEKNPGIKSPRLLSLGYIDFFEPDFFVECRDGLADSIGIKQENLTLGINRIESIESFFGVTKTGSYEFPFGTDMFEVYRYRYSREFQFVKHADAEVAVFRSSQRDALISSALFGDLPDIGRWSGMAEQFRIAFRAKEFELNAHNWVAAHTKKITTPLEFTRTNLKIQSWGRHESHIFIMDPENPLDIIDFWNLRLFEPFVMGLSVDWMTTMGDWLVQSINEHHRPLPGNPFGLTTHSTIHFGRSLTEEKIDFCLEESGIKKCREGSWRYKSWYEPVWQRSTDDRQYRAQRTRISAQEKSLELSPIRHKDSTYCEFSAIAPEFAEEFGRSKVRWMNVVNLNYSYSASNLALILSKDQTSNFRMRMSGSGGVIASTEGLVLPQKFEGLNNFLSISDGDIAISDLLSSKGLITQISPAGRIARQIVEALGGLHEARLIADQETIRLLDSMANSRREYPDGVIEEFVGQTRNAVDWLNHLKKRAKQSFFRNTGLDDFVNANILRLGLKLECPACKTKNWYPIGGIGEENKCDRCLRSFLFPQGNIDFKNTPWSFRVVGPFSVPNLAGGAYATVLTLRAFKYGLGSSPASVLVYSPGLEVEDDKLEKMEIDFAFFFQRSGITGSAAPICLAFGEAKSLAKEAFQQKDVDRLRRIGSRFPGAFLVFSTLKQNLHDDEKQLIKQLAIEGNEIGDDGLPRNPVIVMTGFELFFDWNIDNAWEKDTGGRASLARSSIHFDNLWELARITQKFYL